MHPATFWKSALMVAIGCGGFCVLGDNGSQIPKNSFSCDGRTSGYYADISTGCQVYHMCDGLGRQFSYRCPSKTLFQQRMLICDHWYMVNCSKAEEDYSANLLIGQQGRAFIEDRQFHRTPRPDLADPSTPDFDTYRKSQVDPKFTKNVVGAEEDEDADNSASERKYFPPSHWSTEFSAQPTTLSPAKREESNVAVPGLVKQTFYKTNYNSRNTGLNNQPQLKGKGLNFDYFRKNDNAVNTQVKAVESVRGRNERPPLPNGVNFPSSFKATTPVYPEHLDIDLSKFSDFGNPLEETEEEETNQSSVNFPSKFQATTPVYPKHVETDISRLSEFDIPVEENSNVDSVFVNFASHFKATTPVYPLHVDRDPSKLSEFDLPVDNSNAVNFASKFKATTPVYPKHVDADLSKFSGSEEVPPEQNVAANVAVNFASNFKATTPVYPEHVDVDLSKFSEPVELPEETLDSNKTVNFGSKFKATTPVYPQSVEATSPIPEEFGLLPPHSAAGDEPNTNQEVDNGGRVNFASKFQATTPVYPTSVEPTSPDPNDIGLVAPQSSGQIIESVEPSPDFQPPSFDTTFKRRVDEEDPSVLGNTFSSKQLTEFMLTIKPEQLKDLKQLWHIPEYDFPLDTASRPSYESDFSSFQANPKARKTR